jgi:hypothetical protein
MKTYVNYHGVELYCSGSFDPGEPCEFYDRNGEPGTPGEPPSFDIETIEIGSVDVYTLFDNLNKLHEIENLIILKILENE